MNEEYLFGKLEIEQLDKALVLIRDVFYEYIADEFSDEGVEEFMQFIEPSAIKDMLTQGKIHFWTCEDNGKVIGVLAGENSGYINLLFVNRQYHRKGVARRLLDMMIEQFNLSEITVKSSRYAVEIYRKLGFTETGGEQIVNGIRFIPMKRTRQ